MSTTDKAVGNIMETALKDKSFQRVNSLDFVKGLSICVVIFMHLQGAWLNKEWSYLYAVWLLYVDVFGPSLFIFLSGMTVVFSIKKKEHELDNKSIRKGVFARGYCLIGLGLISNLTNVHIPFPQRIWGWNVLMIIGLSQMTCYYLLKIPKHLRLILGVLLMFSSDFLRILLFTYKDENIIIGILHFILVSPFAENPFLPYIALGFISTIFGELFYENLKLKSRKAFYSVFKQLILFGVIFTIIGLVLPFIQGQPLVGFSDVNSHEYHFINLLYNIQSQNHVTINEIPKMFIRGMSANIFWVSGIALLMVGVCFYFIDIRQRDNSTIDVLKFYGRVSLSLFIIHYFGLRIFFLKLTILQSIFAFIGYTAILGFLMYFWNRKWNGKYTLEWLVSEAGTRAARRDQN